ncbi:MAG: hypothetical protein HGA86_07290, partial [Anaerolineaceae bacterium]|nr:hypothetical protein [Anaerolineaceae bacterium]
QRNAIRSWIELGTEVQVVLVGQEEGMPEFAAEYNLLQLPDVARNEQGTPLISSIFDLARQHSKSPLLAYINADVLVLPDFLEMAKIVSRQMEKFLLIGRRWDLDLTELLEFSHGWQAQLQERTTSQGKMHVPAGSDYFIYPRACFDRIPDFAIGRAGWDNWMIYQARIQKWPTIDATGSIFVVHQRHDYSHLPNGQRHYRLPETDENVRLAGGKRVIFHLEDCDHRLADGRVLGYQRTWPKIKREIETWPLRILRSMFLAEVFYGVFHPKKAWPTWKKKLLGIFTSPDKGGS